MSNVDMVNQNLIFNLIFGIFINSVHMATMIYIGFMCCKKQVHLTGLNHPNDKIDKIYDQNTLYNGHSTFNIMRFIKIYGITSNILALGIVSFV
eukprot:UN12808